MVDVMTIQNLKIKQKEAVFGTKKIITRNGKKLEVIIPSRVRSGTLIKLSGALKITDGESGDLFILINIKSDKLAYAISAIVFIFIVVSIIVIVNAMSTSIENNIDYPAYIKVFENKQPDAISSYGKPLNLENGPNATDPTWETLKNFLISDKTDQQPYVEYSYECVSFAEEIHNHAEARGIKAAFVTIYFENAEYGHALNAFNTTDKGLIFIDCSAQGDYIAHIEKGMAYKLFNLNMFDPIELTETSIIDSVFIYW